MLNWLGAKASPNVSWWSTAFPKIGLYSLWFVGDAWCNLIDSDAGTPGTNSSPCFFLSAGFSINATSLLTVDLVILKLCAIYTYQTLSSSQALGMHYTVKL